MCKAVERGLPGTVLLAAFWLAATGPALGDGIGEPHPLPVTNLARPSGQSSAALLGTSPLCMDRLARMSWPELEALYRAAPAGAIPQGYLRGRAIYCSDSRFAGVQSRVSRAFWHGKVFDSDSETLVNQWCGFRAVRAAVSYGPSWLDGGTSIIMDYRSMSRIWSDVRDEVREVAPGLYLGRMVRRTACGPQFKLYFALEACPCPAGHP